MVAIKQSGKQMHSHGRINVCVKVNEWKSYLVGAALRPSPSELTPPAVSPFVTHHWLDPYPSRRKPQPRWQWRQRRTRTTRQTRTASRTRAKPTRTRRARGTRTATSRATQRWTRWAATTKRSELTESALIGVRRSQSARLKRSSGQRILVS